MRVTSGPAEGLVGTVRRVHRAQVRARTWRYPYPYARADAYPYPNGAAVREERRAPRERRHRRRARPHRCARRSEGAPPFLSPTRTAARTTARVQRRVGPEADGPVLRGTAGLGVGGIMSPEMPMGGRGRGRGGGRGGGAGRGAVDPWIGKTVRITRGRYKGSIGDVTATTGACVRAATLCSRAAYRRLRRRDGRRAPARATVVLTHAAAGRLARRGRRERCGGRSGRRRRRGWHAARGLGRRREPGRGDAIPRPRDAPAGQPYARDGVPDARCGSRTFVRVGTVRVCMWVFVCVLAVVRGQWGSWCVCWRWCVSGRVHGRRDAAAVQRRIRDADARRRRDARARGERVGHALER